MPKNPTSNELLSTYINATEITNTGAIWVTEKGVVLGSNQHFANLLGYTQTTITERLIFEINPHLTFLNWRQLWQEILEQKQPIVKTELLTNSNSLLPVRVRWAYVELEGLICACGLVEDSISSNKSKQTDELYLMSFCMDYATECILWVDKHGIITYANHATALTYDFLTEEMKGQPIGRFVPHFKEDDYATHWQHLAESGMLEGEEKHLKQGGDFFPVWVSHNYITYEAKSFNCIFLKDLTDQKSREESWKLSMTTIQQASDMIFWVQLDGQIFYVNEATTTSLGYSLEQLQKLKIFDISPVRNQENWKAHLAKVKIQKHATYESLMRRKNGKVFPVEITINFIIFEENTIISAYVKDITERKAESLRLEMAYEEIQQLKETIEAENTLLKEDIELEYSFKNIISKSEGYKTVLKKVEQVATTDATVLILGETGTGKELLARAVHQLSTRSDRSMIKVNCGALPANLIESELFGHEKGAFTGAIQTKKGRFELAHKGTIFLDEIGELPLDLQTKLLRVLQEGEFERVGGTKTIQVDVRIVAATNRNLLEKVQEAKFREDLYYRLNVFPIYNIPLRERREDIAPLVRFFVDKYSKKMGKTIKEIPETTLKKLQAYDFPGNVRELENIIERSLILSNSSRLFIDKELLRQESVLQESFLSLDEIQKKHILKALVQTKGRISGVAGAANLLQMNSKTLTSRMLKLGIEKQDYLLS